MEHFRDNSVIRNSLGQSHEIMMKAVREGDTVIDATAGNGGDTVFLARLVGAGGRVYSFDIQQRALDRTLEKLKAEGLEDRVSLIRDGHQNMDVHGTGKIRAAMFNLGYLPGGDHSIGTRAGTAVPALEKAMELLEVHGIITMVIYYGGDSGFDEKERIMEYIKHIDPRRFSVMKSEFVNQINCPPILICIEKLMG